MQKRSINPFRPAYPSPAALVTSVSEDGRPNIITLGEVFNISIGVGTQPVILGIAIAKPRYSHATDQRHARVRGELPHVPHGADRGPLRHRLGPRRGQVRRVRADARAGHAGPAAADRRMPAERRVPRAEHPGGGRSRPVSGRGAGRARGGGSPRPATATSWSTSWTSSATCTTEYWSSGKRLGRHGFSRQYPASLHNHGIGVEDALAPNGSS